MRLKKITALFLTGALILSMAGCAGNGSKDKKEGSAGNEAQEPVKIATKPMTEQFYPRRNVEKAYRGEGRL